MTARLSRLLRRTCRQPRILPMSRADEREIEELHRRREARRQRNEEALARNKAVPACNPHAASMRADARAENPK